MYRQISDACARAGSRLTLTVTSALTRHSFCTGAQSFSYRSIERCPLRCGTTSALQAACLTIETLGALSRLGCNVSREHIRQGLAATSLSYHFSPLSIQPLIIADCVTDADDLTALLQTLQELSPTLPKPLRAIPDPAMPDTERARLLEICGGEMSEESSLISEDEGTLLLVGSRNFLDGIVAQRT
jgi:folylpolyglutamate synthase/dihydropteroate synthase